MTKKKNKLSPPPVAPTTNKKTIEHIPAKNSSLNNFRAQAILLAIICFVFYYNTFSNEYALDDELVITNNEYVQKGFEGIPDILTTDIFDSYAKEMNGKNTLTGSRYRPLSMVTFAIEQQLFGEPVEDAQITPSFQRPVDTHLAHTQHVVNVLLYILAVIVLLYLFRTVLFPTNPVIAFTAALLFAIHPIHTEVVANIKSRDEILSLLFITLTFIYAWKYKESLKLKHIIIALCSLFLALLSKEYGLTLILLIPLMFYIFKNYSVTNSIKASLPYVAVCILYLIIRFSIVPLNVAGDNTELMNNPYLLATGSEKLATIIATQLNYIKLLLFPHPLSSDYSYNQIPYTSFANPLVWLSIVVYGSLIILFFRLLKSRHVLAFAIAFFLLNWVIISNLFFNIGATMGERLIFHSSVGFTIAVAYLLYHAYERINIPLRKQVGIATLVVLTVLGGYKTIARNADWENNISLYTKDVETSPNSVSLNSNMGTNYAIMSDRSRNREEKDALLKKAATYWSKALAIYPRHIMSHINRASYYLRFGLFDSAINDLDSVKKYDPAFPTLGKMYAGAYLKNVLRNYNQPGKYAEGSLLLEKGVKEDPQSAPSWYYLGSFYANLGQYDKSLYALENAHKLSPNDPPLEHLMDSVKRLSGNSN